MLRTLCNPRRNVERDLREVDASVLAYNIGLYGVEEHLEQVDDVAVNIVVLKMSTPCIV